VFAAHVRAGKAKLMTEEVTEKQARFNLPLVELPVDR
jgi:hypothetical protein